MTDRDDGPWDVPTEHDDRAGAHMGAEDPPTVRADEVQQARLRAATAPGTLPPPNRTREPAKPAPKLVAAPPATADAGDGVLLLDRVSGNAPSGDAPLRGESAAGGIMVVASGSDGDRVRRLCHKHGLLVPVMASLAVVHDALSIVVIGEPSPPAPERVVHVVRPSVPDEQLVDLLRALATAHVVVEPRPAPSDLDARIADAAHRLASVTDRGAIEHIVIETIAALTASDRAHCLFHEPASGALWSESRRRERGDDRHAMGGLAGWAAHTGQTLHASPAGDDPRWLVEIDDPDGKAQSRLLVQPIIGADRRVHAVLVAVRRWRNTDFSPRERELLAQLAAAVGPTIDLAVAASGGAPRRKATIPGPLASRQSAVIAAPRVTGDSRPPPLTTRLTRDAEPLPRASEVDVERYSAESLPSVPTVPRRETARRPATESEPPPRPKAPTGPVTVKRAGSHEPRDVAVVASEDDARRVQRLAKKARLELSTFESLADAPDYFQVITIGAAWTPEAEHRVAYAARAEIADEDLLDLLVALTTDRAVAAPSALTKPNSAAEARRAQIALTGARGLAVTAQLADAESIAVTTVRDLLDPDRAYCLFFDADTGALWSENRRHAGADNRRAIAGIVGWAARTGRAASVPRAGGDARWLGPLDDPDGDPNSQLLVQPVVRTDRRVQAVLVAARRARRPGFTDLDAGLLARFAAMAAPLFEQIQLAHETQRMIGEDTASRPVAAPTPDPAWRQIVRGTHALSRWVFLALGVVVALIIAAIAL